MKFANPVHAAALAAYPVGSIYMSVNATNPGTLFGGTWERIQGRFLLAADADHVAGSTGGEETHALTVDEMPAHTHDGKTRQIGKINAAPDLKESSNVSEVNVQYAERGTGTATWNWSSYRWDDTPDSNGNNQPHNNMPPYIAVYCWKRTA